MNPHARLNRRMAVWFSLYLLAAVCGLNPIDLTTIVWVTILSMVICNKEGW